MDIGTLSAWAAFIAAALAIFTTIRTEFMGPARQALVKIGAVEERLTRAEATIEALPSQQVMHQLELQLADMRGDIRELAAKLQPIAAAVNRIQESLLERP